MEQLTGELAREKTKKLLESPDVDLSYITDEIVAKDMALSDGLAPDGSAANLLTTYFGNNPRYGLRVLNGQNVPCYYFENGGGGEAEACLTTQTGWLDLTWHHTHLGLCPNGREKWRFDHS